VIITDDGLLGNPVYPENGCLENSPRTSFQNAIAKKQASIAIMDQNPSVSSLGLKPQIEEFNLRESSGGLSLIRLTRALPSSSMINTIHERI
jgi:hypothetical protein